MPKLYKSRNGLIKFQPNQEGYFDGGKHKWYINELGLPGKVLPDSYDNLITLIGDSYIQNFMNPDSCHQSSFLRKINQKYNYIEAARDGATLLEYFEITKELDSLNPVLHLIYVNSSDFFDCFSNNPYDVKFDTIKNKIIYSKYNESKLKLIIPYLNFTEYLYRKYYKDIQSLILKTSIWKTKKHFLKKNQPKLDLAKIKVLLNFVEENYHTEKVVFIFHPNVNDNLIKIVDNYGIKNFKLKRNIDNWIIKNDIHWTCEAHFEITKQVSLFLDEFYKQSNKLSNIETNHYDP